MKLFHREKGKASLPPLIILHGLWGASDNWLQVAEILSTNFHVLLPDFRNHGHSPHTDVHTYPALAEDICEWIESLHLKTPLFIAGHSMGGKCLMHILLKYPSIVTKAAIIDIAPKKYEPTEEHRQIIQFLKQFSFIEGESRAQLHQRIRKELKDERICQILLKNIDKRENGFRWRINVTTILESIQALMTWENCTKQCKEPTLFIRGELSEYIQTNDVFTIKSLFPQSEFITINGAGHWIHAQQPQMLAEALKQFFRVNKQKWLSGINPTAI